MNEKNKFKVLTFIRYLGDSFFYPFLALYLHSLSFGEAKIGYLIAIIPFISILCNPIYSRLCKNTKILKNTLSIISFIEAIVIIGIIFASNYYFILALIILLSISGTSHYGLLDSLSTKFAKANNVNFSNIRMYGSISYIIGLIFGGYIIDYIGFNFSFFICSGLFILSSILYLLIKPIYDNVNNVEEKRNYKEVFNNKSFILFLIFYLLCFGTEKASNNFYSLLLESKGINSTGYGYVYAFGVVVEVVCLILFNKFDKKLNYKIMLLIGMLLLSIQNLINATNFPVGVIIASYAFRGIAFSILLHINYKILVNLVGVKNSTIVILLEELGVSIFVILSNALGGLIIENISYNVFYLILGIIGVINLIYYIIFVQRIIIKNDKLEVASV